MKYLITLEVESEWSLEQLTKGQHGALIFGANHPWRVLEAKEGERGRGSVMPEPRLDDDIAIGLDEEEGEDESYDTLEEKYAD
jgi:hypothetical protein